MKAIKPFTTRLQRFAEGDTVPADTDLAPHSRASLEAAGVLPREKPAPAAESQPSGKPASTTNFAGRKR